MKKFLSLAIAALFLFLAATTTRFFKHPAAASGVVLSQQPAQTDKRLEKLQRLKIQDSHGEPAATHVRQLRRLSKGIARAMQDAEKKGLRKAFEHSRVILGTEPSDNSNGTARSTPAISRRMQIAAYNASHPQQTFTDGEYEVTFIPYDDGDPNNWEGIIYRYNPDWGDDIRFGVIDIQNETPTVVQEVYYPAGGEDPQPLNPLDPSPINNISDVRSCKPASSKLLVKTKSNLPGGSAPACTPPFKTCLRLRDECCSPPPNLQPWLQCSAKACVLVAATCSRTGPVFGECWGFGCTGGMLMCLV